MYFPLTQTFNFFDDIFSLIELAKKQDFIKFENQTWPGKRTLSISQLNFNLFSYVTRRQLRLFYDLELNDSGEITRLIEGRFETKANITR